jgi:hypothetical protein
VSAKSRKTFQLFPLRTAIEELKRQEARLEKLAAASATIEARARANSRRTNSDVRSGCMRFSRSRAPDDPLVLPKDRKPQLAYQNSRQVAGMAPASRVSSHHCRACFPSVGHGFSNRTKSNSPDHRSPRERIHVPGLAVCPKIDDATNCANIVPQSPWYSVGTVSIGEDDEHAAPTYHMPFSVVGDFHTEADGPRELRPAIFSLPASPCEAATHRNRSLLPASGRSPLSV